MTLNTESFKYIIDGLKAHVPEDPIHVTDEWLNTPYNSNMSNLPKDVSDALQREIDSLYKSVAIEMELLLACHLDPLTNRANNGGSFRRI
jgi:hypothetical protein